LGLLVNDPGLYRQAVQATAAVNKITTQISSNQGLLGALVQDEAFKGEAKKALEDLKTALSHLVRGARPLEESLNKLPELVKKTEAFLDNLEQASRTLPELMVEGQGLLSEADKVAQAAQKTWLLRRHLPKPRERTIRLDREPRGEQ